uniref:TAZ-type domain-containing protein n=1 Tax=Echinococcus canadensis TaxID=519352 RepID=A0A915F0D8_9CEST
MVLRCVYSKITFDNYWTPNGHPILTPPKACSNPHCVPIHCELCSEKYPVCELMRYALMKRLYPAERKSEQANHEYTLAREQGSEVLGFCELLELLTYRTFTFLAVNHAICCAKYFEDDINAKASAIDRIGDTGGSLGGITRTQILCEQLRRLLYAKWCLTVRTSPRTRTDPHCPNIHNVYRHVEKCTAGVNHKLSQCAPATHLATHFDNRQCAVCEPLRYALEKRFHPIERKGGQLNREIILTRGQRSKVRILDLHFLGMEHATQCAKYFEDDIYTEASSVEQYPYTIMQYAIS